MQINILFDDRIETDYQGNVDEYVVTFGGNEIWRQRVSYWRAENEEDALTDGRQDFASKLREALELVDKFDDLKDKLGSLGRLDNGFR